MKIEQQELKDKLNRIAARKNVSEIEKLYKTATQFKIASFFPSAISATLAALFIYFLTESMTFEKRLLLCSLSLFILIGWEVVKHYVINRTAERYYNDTANFLTYFLCFVVVVPNALLSGFGGDKTIKEARSAPTLSYEKPEILDLEKKMIEVNASIKKQEGTTWKGSVTRTANNNLSKLYQQKTDLLDQYNKAKELIISNHQTATLSHQGENNQLGIAFFIIGFLVDLVLLLTLWNKEISEWRIAKLLRRNNVGFSLSDITVTDSGITENKTPGFLNAINAFKTENKRKNDSVNGKTQTITVNDLRKKNCVNCGKLFEYKNSRAKYCSDACKNEYHNTK